MEYKRFGNTLVCRIDRGELIMENLKEILKAENVKLAKINAIGAASEMKIGSFTVESKTYHQHEYKGDYEIMSLIGNITTKDGELYPHLHIVAGDEKGNVVGGHFNEAVVGVTCEMFIDILDGTVERQVCEQTGINIFKF